MSNLTTEQPCEHDWLDMHEAGKWGMVCQKCGANKPRPVKRAKRETYQDIVDEAYREHEWSFKW